MKRKIHLLSWDTVCRPKEWGEAGIRRSEDMDKSLLAKLGWRLLTCGEETWCQVMREKYGLREGMPLHFKQKHHESHIWRGVVRGSELLRDGLRWKVRNGRSVYFRSNRWVGDVKLMDQSQRHLEKEDLELTVSNLWREQQGRRWELLSTFLPAYWLLKLAERRLSWQDTREDEFGWLELASKKFTVKSAYLLLRGNQDFDGWEGWKKIWRLKTQQRIKLLLWMMAHDKILTNHSRWHRHIALSQNCDRCDATVEEVLHAIRGCAKLKEVWVYFVPPTLRRDFFSSQNLKEWLLQNLKRNERDAHGDGWLEVMALICWRLWKWRHSRLFDDLRLTLCRRWR